MHALHVVTSQSSPTLASFQTNSTQLFEWSTHRPVMGGPISKPHEDPYEITLREPAWSALGHLRETSHQDTQRDDFAIGLWLSNPHDTTTFLPGMLRVSKDDGNGFPYIARGHGWDFESLLKCQWNQARIHPPHQASHEECLAFLQRFFIEVLAGSSTESDSEGVTPSSSDEDTELDPFETCTSNSGSDSEADMVDGPTSTVRFDAVIDKIGEETPPIEPWENTIPRTFGDRFLRRRSFQVCQTEHARALASTWERLNPPDTRNGTWPYFAPENMIVAIKAERARRRSFPISVYGEWANAAKRLVSNARRTFGLQFDEYLVIESIVCLAMLIAQEIKDDGEAAFPLQEAKPIERWVWPVLPVMQDIINRDLAQWGWCPYALWKLYHRTSFSVLFWMWRSAFRGGATGVHIACDNTGCSQEKLAGKPAQHGSGCSGECGQPVKLDGSALTDILTSNRVPLVTIETIEGIPQIGCEPHTGQDYIAFSHVWSQGRGSHAEVGLPSCQVEDLLHAVRNVLPGDKLYFWVDSLCIPKDPTMRANAIGAMSAVYKNAKAVVVIDDTLNGTALGGFAESPPDLWLTRLLVSPWSNRLWTYQEGALPGQLVFRIANQYVRLQPEIERFELVTPEILASEVRPRGQVFPSEPRALLYQLRAAAAPAFRPQALSRYELLQELNWRTTKNAEDETIAIFALLNLETSRLHEILQFTLRDGSHQRPLVNKEAVCAQRMRAFFLILGNVPKYVVFVPGPRLPFENFGWAPVSLVAKREIDRLHRISRSLDDVYHNQSAMGSCTEEGLTATYQVLSPERTFIPKNCSGSGLRFTHRTGHYPDIYLLQSLNPSVWESILTPCTHVLLPAGWGHIGGDEPYWVVLIAAVGEPPRCLLSAPGTAMRFIAQVQAVHLGTESVGLFEDITAEIADASVRLV